MKERVHGHFKTGGIVHILPSALQELKIERQIPSKKSREESYRSWVMKLCPRSISFQSYWTVNLSKVSLRCMKIPLRCYIQSKEITKYALQSRFQANASWEPIKGGLYSSRRYRDDERIDPPWVKCDIYGQIRKANDQKTHVS